jgi:opacity protein-like surface antigen
MKTLLRAAALALLALLAVPARAQDLVMSSGSYKPERSMFAINWEIAQPISGFADYIDRLSMSGFSMETRSLVRPNVSAGFSFSYNRFDQTFPAYQQVTGTTTVTGPVYRYADLFALRALAHYYFLQGSMIEPYIGGGIGAAWAYGYQQVADFSNTQSNIDFIVSPEIGATVMLARGSTNLGLNLAVRYTYTTADFGKTKDAQTFSGIVGLMWSY